MTNEQQGLIDKAIAILQQAKDINEVIGWAKSRAAGIKTRVADIDAQTALEDFDNKEQAACTSEFMAVLDKLTQTTIRGQVHNE